MVTTEELKKQITEVFNESYSMQVYLLMKTGDDFELKLADVEDENAGPAMKDMFHSYIETEVLKNEELQVCALSKADERVNSIYHYDYETLPEELKLFAHFNITEAVSNDKFDFAKDDLASAFGYIIYLGTMDKGMVLFKKHYPIFLIKRDSFLLGLKSNSRFEKIMGSDIIRLNGTVQLFKLGDEIYVKDISVLERNTSFSLLVRKSAEEAIHAIEKLDLIEDIEILKDSIEDVSFARKLSKTKHSSPIFKLNIPKETIVEFTKNTAALSGRFKYSEDGKTIKLDTKKSKDAFIKLMNDAFLRSELTKQYYEVLAKDSIESDK